MWTAAGSNMVVGTDMTVDTSNTATKLFTLTATGEAKLSHPVYTKFKGKEVQRFLASAKRPLPLASLYRT